MRSYVHVTCVYCIGVSGTEVTALTVYMHKLYRYSQNFVIMIVLFECVCFPDCRLLLVFAVQFGGEGQMVSHGIPEAPGVLWRGCHVGNRVFIHVKCSQLTAGSKEW